MSALLLNVWHDYVCGARPSCGVSERIRPLAPNAVRMHHCASLRGVVAPLVLAGSDCVVYAVEREDFLNGEMQASNQDGTPIMAVRTDYADGHNDLVVNPGVARIKFS